jgi:iron complex outermembrane recepter protein
VCATVAYLNSNNGEGAMRMSRFIRRSVVNDVHILIHGQAAKNRLAAAAGALGALACSGQIFAADATPEPTNTTPTADTQLEEIVVTGIRASLQKSLDIKQQSVGVVDAISAEDIGAFPDASLGEAMQRIPGVTVTRTSMRGQGGPELYTGAPSGITVRGFGGDFNETLIDGRPQATASGGGNAGRGFDFSSVGADFVSEMDVLKTPDFGLSSGAVGATVNIKFPKPFDHPGLQVSAFGSTTETTNDGSFRPSVGALFSNTFFDNTLGVLVDGDYSDTRVSAHHQDIVGWKGTYLNSCQMAGGPACVDKFGTVIPKNSLVLGNGQDPNNTNINYNPVNPANTYASWYPQEYQLYNDRTDVRRKDGRVVLQWHPTDQVLVTIDDNYSDESQFAERYAYSTWFNSSQMYNVQQDTNGTITNFQYGPAPTDLDASVGGTYLKNNTIGLNVKWDVSDQVKLQLDADQSESHLNPNGSLDPSVDIGYGPSYNVFKPNFPANQAAGFPNAYVGGIALPGGSNNLPYYSAYGPNNNSADSSGVNPLILGSHVLGITSQRAADQINQGKIDADWHTDTTSVDAGLQFVEDTRNALNFSSFANNAWQLWSGYGSPSGNTGGQALPASLFANSGNINTSNFFPGFKNNGQLPPLFMYNPYAVYNYLTGLGPAGANPGTINGPNPPACVAGTLGCYSPYTGGPEPVPIDPGSISYVRDKTYAPFVTWSHKLNIGDRPLTVNLGLRYERTTTTTGGYGRVPNSLTVNANDHTAYVVGYTPAQFITTSNTDSHLLPSLDLNFFPISDLKVRFDASRTLTRPPLGEILPTLSVSSSRVGALGLTGNNPGLKPYESNNFDLGGEWYYGQNEYLVLDTFFKHVSDFPEQSTVNVTIPGLIDPTTGQTAQWAKTTFVNSPTANVYGAEIGWQKMLVYGFGYQVNGTVVHTNEPYNRYNLGPQFFLPGLANSVNFVGFYQNHGFQARVAVNWTATQLIATTQEQSGGAFGNEPVFTRPFTEVDFSTQYDISDHFSVFFKALNLTDAEVVEHGRFDNQLLNVQDIGRTFTMGVRAKL